MEEQKLIKEKEKKNKGFFKEEQKQTKREAERKKNERQNAGTEYTQNKTESR